MKTFEKLVNEIMEEFAKDGEPVTREEAEEMARQEMNAKEVTDYARSQEAIIKDVKKERKPRTVKISDEKKALFTSILTNLTRCEDVEKENIRVITENKLIQVDFGGKTFEIDLREKRKPKK